MIDFTEAIAVGFAVAEIAQISTHADTREATVGVLETGVQGEPVGFNWGLERKRRGVFVLLMNGCGCGCEEMEGGMLSDGEFV